MRTNANKGRCFRGIMEIEKLKVKIELILDDLTLPAGAIVDGVKAEPETYKVFARNGWWAVPAKYFK